MVFAVGLLPQDFRKFQPGRIHSDFMRAVIQRVSTANVSIENEIVGSIQQGLLVLLAIEETDGDDDILWLSMPHQFGHNTFPVRTQNSAP